MKRSIVGAITLLLASVLAMPCALAERNFSARRPAASTKVLREAAMQLHGAHAREIHLAPLAGETVDAIVANNRQAGLRALRIGIVRDVATQPGTAGSALAWRAVAGGSAAQWRVTSEGAVGLRVELSVDDAPEGVRVRFASASPNARVYEMAVPASGTLWSPVIEGQEAIVELFAPHGIRPSSLAVRVSHIAHHVVDIASGTPAMVEKSSGPASCEIDVACVAKDDAALARASSAVSRIAYIRDGSAWVCTGTLLNPGDGSFTPYYLTAAHCIGDAATAATAVTLWFDEASACGAADAAAPVQLEGGAQLLFADATLDGALLRLNQVPPEDAVYAGWDSLPLEPQLPVVGLHHPGGGLMKVSEGAETEYSDQRFVAATWIQGVTEGGSSGSGLFTQVDSPAHDYLLRGTLVGGTSACGSPAPSGFDLYSRFDLLWPKLAPYLSANAKSANHSGLWSNPDEPGWGLEVSHQQGFILAALFAYARDGSPEWLVGAQLDEKADGDFSGALYRMSGPAFDAPTWGRTVMQSAGTMRLTFSSSRRAHLSYTVDGATVEKDVAPMAFGSSGPPACSFTDEDRSHEANYQDLWIDPAEAGWGVAVAHQGDRIFAIVFTFGEDGTPTWLAGPSLARGADGRYTGVLFRTSGSALTSDGHGVSAAPAGEVALEFADGQTGTVSYSIDGRSVRKPIVRFAASPSAPVCR